MEEHLLNDKYQSNFLTGKRAYKFFMKYLWTLLDKVRINASRHYLITASLLTSELNNVVK